MNKANINFKKAWNLINKSKRIFLTTHEKTDGDDLGSLLAIYNYLNEHKELFAAVKKGVPDSLKFLPESDKVKDDFKDLGFDLIITFGCSNVDRPGFPKLKELKLPILNFDHHPDNLNFGDTNVVDPKASSVAELIYFFLQSGEVKITKDIATCLLTGIFTDTGGFKHANTTSVTLETAATLMKKGARIDKITTNLMANKKAATLKAWSRGLENIRFDSDKKLLLTVLTNEDLEEIQAKDEDLEGFVEFLNRIPQAKYVLFLRQDGDIVRGSLRSNPNNNVDVSKIAHSFGGGGHKLASGFKIKGHLVKLGDGWQIQ